MKVAIVTGTSRGLGRALAQQMVNHGYVVYGFARSAPCPPIAAVEDEAGYRHVFSDLSHVFRATEQLEEILDRARGEVDGRIVLVNNAGQLSPVRPMQRISPGEIGSHTAVNFEAVAAFMSRFLAGTQELEASREIVNITSGAAGKPYAGWSLYCATKAAVNMLTQVAAREQEGRPNPARVIAVAPGVVDTHMQTTIRGTSEEDFPSRERFVKLFEEGQLEDVEHAASLVLRALDDREIENGAVIDVRKSYAD